MSRARCIAHSLLDDVMRDVQVQASEAGKECTTSQGRRRLELFGEDHNIRPGWVTIGRDLSGSNFSPQACALDSLVPQNPRT